MWDLAPARPGDPTPASQLPKPQNHSPLWNVQKTGNKNFMETFLWGLVKSFPTPTWSSPAVLAHTVLTRSRFLPAGPLTCTFKANLNFIVHAAHCSEAQLAGSRSGTAAPPQGPEHAGGEQSFREQGNVRVAEEPLRQLLQQQESGTLLRPSQG